MVAIDEREGNLGRRKCKGESFGRCPVGAEIRCLASPRNYSVDIGCVQLNIDISDVDVCIIEAGEVPIQKIADQQILIRCSCRNKDADSLRHKDGKN